MTEAHATINREIAEGLGWSLYDDKWGYQPEALHDYYHLRLIPDYINSADASAALEDELHRRGWMVSSAIPDCVTMCVCVKNQSEAEYGRETITTSASAARRLALAMCAAEWLKRQENDDG